MQLIGAGTGLIELVRDDLRAEPFSLLDIGCSGGIDREWRSFEPHLRAVGIDPNVNECERLSRSEANKNVRYVSGFADWDKVSDFVRVQGSRSFFGNNPWGRLAVSQTIEIRSSKTLSNEQLTRENQWQRVDLSPRHIMMSDLLDQHEMSDVDFIKIDVDGPDFLILQSMKEQFSKRRVIGTVMEVNFFGSDHPSDHTFHNTDRFMRSIGFELFGLTQRFYSMRALPQRYELAVPAQSVRGRPFQGDALYCRDLGDPRSVAPFDLTREKVLKLAVLFDMFDKPDHAAEVLITHKSLIGDTDHMLDWLAGREDIVAGGYDAYMRKFMDDDEKFYTAPRPPVPQRKRAPDPEVSTMNRPSVFSRLKSFVRRTFMDSQG